MGNGKGGVAERYSVYSAYVRARTLCGGGAAAPRPLPATNLPIAPHLNNQSLYLQHSTYGMCMTYVHTFTYVATCHTKTD
eukprot:scaffold200952_cov41-Tisochrysis_lutea.AAC.1